MTVGSSLWLWVGGLVVGVLAAHWGAERFAKPLKGLRRRWGLTPVAGGALVGLAAASPEIGINVASAARGVSDIGLGVTLGSNVVAIPLMVTAAFLASRTPRLGGSDRPRGPGDRPGDGADSDGADSDGADSDGAAGGGGGGSRTGAHERHRREGLLRVQREAVTVLALPYLGILALVAALTLPAGWRGLQPVDGGVMVLAYLAFLGQAVLRGRRESESVEWDRREVALAAAGLAVLAGGTYLTVRATEHIALGLGLSRLVTGLFVTALMAAAPELFATWSVVRSGQVTAGTTSVLGDHAVTMTVAFAPLALTTVRIEDFRLYWVNLTFVAAMPAAYTVFLHVGSAEHGFERWQVLALDGLYILYVAVVAGWVLNIV